MYISPYFYSTRYRIFGKLCRKRWHFCHLFNTAKTRNSLSFKALANVTPLYPDKGLKPTMPLFTLNFFENKHAAYFYFCRLRK
jgi:hypothetical protein